MSTAYYNLLLYFLENIAHLGKCSTLGKNECSVAIWPILLLNSVQIVTSIDRQLLNGLIMRDYAPFVLTAVQWPQEAPSQFVRINQPVQLKHCRECNMEKIALRLSLDPNIALGFASCYISLLTVPSCYFFHIVLTAVL